MAKSNKFYLTDLVGEDYKTWEIGDRIIFKSGTGTGKTTFCIKQLGLYCAEQGERIMYICNRKKLEESICEEIEKVSEETGIDLRDTITVTKYQNLEKDMKSHPYNTKTTLRSHKYIFLDECHYFTTDAPINPYTEVLFKYFKNTKNNILIYASATAELYFNHLTKRYDIPETNIYEIQRDFSFVKEVIIYEKDKLISLLEKIINTEVDSKALVFCSSGDRIMEIYNYFGEKLVDIFCSRSYSDKRVLELRNVNAIKDNTFSKRILITTSVVDNGIDLKDKKLKHVITEMITYDSIIQTLGRKRVVDDEDECNYYIRKYTNKEITSLLNNTQHELDIASLWKKNKEEFTHRYQSDRNVIRFSKILWYDVKDGGIAINQLAHTKYVMNKLQFTQMKKEGFTETLEKYLPDSLRPKIRMITNEDIKDEFKLYLQSIEGYKFYKDDLTELKNKFKEDMTIYGKKSRRYGIDTLNEYLDEKYGSQYDKRFVSIRDTLRKLSDGTPNPNLYKTYIILN